MTLAEAKKLKWGTLLEPTQTGRKQLKEHRQAIFMGISKGSFIVAVPMGGKTVHYYAPVFWKAKAGTVL